MTEKPPPALVAAPEKTGGETGLPGTTHQPGFGGQKHPKTVERKTKRKAVRCESTALYGVCQARTTTSSSLYAYPPVGPPETGRTAVENAGRALRALLWHGQGGLGA